MIRRTYLAGGSAGRKAPPPPGPPGCFRIRVKVRSSHPDQREGEQLDEPIREPCFTRCTCKLENMA